MLTFDFRDFERAAARMGAMADQIPFALAQSMNDASKAARREIIDTTWADHVQVRNKRFMGVALRQKFANKRNLRVEIFDNLGRASLALHEEGGSKTSKQGNLAIPSSRIGGKRTGWGVPKGMRPKVLPNSFRKGDAIYQRTGSYKKATKSSPARDGRGLKLMYVLRPSAPSSRRCRSTPTSTA